MDGERGEALGRDAPFPDVMQGRWVVVDYPSDEADFQGSEVIWFGKPLEYEDKRLILCDDGGLRVEVDFADQVEGDELVLQITPQGALGVINDHFGALLVRPSELAEWEARLASDAAPTP